MSCRTRVVKMFYGTLHPSSDNLEANDPFHPQSQFCSEVGEKRGWNRALIMPASNGPILLVSGAAWRHCRCRTNGCRTADLDLTTAGPLRAV